MQPNPATTRSKVDISHAKEGTEEDGAVEVDLDQAPGKDIAGEDVVGEDEDTMEREEDGADVVAEDMVLIQDRTKIAIGVVMERDVAKVGSIIKFGSCTSRNFVPFLTIQ
jgi:hypothetical protein